MADTQTNISVNKLSDLERELTKQLSQSEGRLETVRMLLELMSARSSKTYVVVSYPACNSEG
ncbi:MAG: hypothetical protein HY521_15200 [Proteobacteria bacterium]|nr:hypothetical protein [Pseudomonadota bacterium]